MIENDDDEYSISTSEYSIDECDNMYEPEEISSTKYNLVLAEIYNEFSYGINNFSEINNCYIVLYRFKQYKKDNIDECIENYLLDLGRRSHTNHSTIRNYNSICFNIKPEIAECVYLHTGECVCIFKTFWLRLIQRTWKTIFKIRQTIIKHRCNIQSLLYRETRGNWPDVCLKLPTLFGMLSHYKSL